MADIVMDENASYPTTYMWIDRSDVSLIDIRDVILP